ncbi:zinc ribbon domain-containing protein [Aliarcobacter butzleri]|uniref:zinc ribbon domain-containing protein n=1 Tax=Aliarcobacter butzleri TaxID=28197 RepID=UPI00125EED8F|nr:zinc ribbon domain-containing protein [Aliarcobacter butzleri]
MALINCPECNAEISNQSLVCIKCGYNLEEYIRRKEYLTNRNSEYFNSEKLKKDIDTIESNALYILISIVISIFLTTILGIIYGNFDTSTFFIFAILFAITTYISKWIYGIKKSSAVNRIVNGLSPIYPIFNQSANISNFSVIKQNVQISSYNKDILLAKMYIFAYQLNADAIVTGDISSQTSTYTTARVDRGLLGIGSASIKNDVHSSTTNYITVTYLKYNEII